MIDLKPFCAKRSDPREWMRTPWFHRGHVYATNGHVLVRCPEADSKHHLAIGGCNPIKCAKIITNAGKRRLKNISLGVPMAASGVTRFGNICFDSNYIALIAKLPGVKFQANGADKPAYFSFRGGEGVVMPYAIPPAELLGEIEYESWLSQLTGANHA